MLVQICRIVLPITTPKDNFTRTEFCFVLAIHLGTKKLIRYKADLYKSTETYETVRYTLLSTNALFSVSYKLLKYKSSQNTCHIETAGSLENVQFLHENHV